jgi:hypothetical protein
MHTRPQKVLYSLLRIKLLSITNKHYFYYNHKLTRLYPRNKTKYDVFVINFIKAIDSNIISKLYPNKTLKISSLTSEMLYNYYSKDISNLEKLTGMNYADWNFS